MRASGLGGLLLGAVLAAACRPAASAVRAVSALRGDRIFDAPSELCDVIRDRAPAEEATCRGRPVGPALRRYQQSGATFTAGFVPFTAEAVVGEPVFVAFVLRNDGDRPIGLHPDGYHTQATRRAARFQLTAIGPGGAPVADADRSMELDAVAEGQMTLLPGQTYVEDLVLPEWALLDRPGTYAITATRRTMGWDETGTNAEIRSELAIEVLPASPARLGAVIEELGKEAHAPVTPESWRHRRASGRALRGLLSIDHPAVVPYLAEAVKHVPGAALLVLAGMPRFNSPERRRVAIEALAAPDRWVRRSAAEALGFMPSGESVKALGDALSDDDDEVRRVAAQSLRAVLSGLSRR
jgi:hypothetical protein